MSKRGRSARAQELDRRMTSGQLLVGVILIIPVCGLGLFAAARISRADAGRAASRRLGIEADDERDQTSHREEQPAD